MRKILALFILLASMQQALAMTLTKATERCPIDGQEFTDTVMASDSRSGRMLDLKPVGPGAGIWKYMQCPRDGFVLYDTFSEAEIERLKPYVLSDEYQAMRKTETPHWLVAKMRIHMSDPGDVVAGSLLTATWEANAEQYPVYAAAARDMFLDIYNSADPARVQAGLLAGELCRRLGSFEEAEKLFQAISSDAGCDEKVCQQVCAQELGLIKAKNSDPAQMKIDKR